MGNLNKIVLEDETLGTQEVLEVEDTKARADIGDVTTLKTSTKESIVNAVNEVFQFASDLKAKIAAAITGKGVETSKDATGDVMAANIAAIKTGVDTFDATASDADVLSGRTYYRDNVKKTGAMIDRTGQTNGWCGYEAVSVQTHGVDTTQAYVLVPNVYGHPGYYDSSSTVTCNIANLNAGNIKAGVMVGRMGGDTTNNIKGTFTSDGNATAGQILAGRVAYVNGAKVTGTMADLTGADQQANGVSVADGSNVKMMIPASGHYVYGKHIYATFAAVASAIGLTAAKLVSGNTVLGIAGTGGGRRYATGICTSSNTSVVNDRYYWHTYWVGSTSSGSSYGPVGIVTHGLPFTPSVIRITTKYSNGKTYKFHIFNGSQTAQIKIDDDYTTGLSYGLSDYATGVRERLTTHITSTTFYFMASYYSALSDLTWEAWE